MDWQKENQDLLEKMVSVPSVSGTENTLAGFLKDYFSRIGVDAKITRLDDNSSNLTAEIRFGGGRQKVLLGGHLDTVPPAKDWESNPFQIKYEGDRAYGLGACDMKGGLAAQITVLHKMKKEGTKFDGTVFFAAVADEEAFSAGANRLVEDGIQADIAILAEPHFDNVVTGACGKGLISLEATGAAGHAARPETGINAVNSMAALLEKLEGYYRKKYEEKQCGAYCPLRIYSDYPGYSLNIPDCCRTLVNKQLLIGENLEDFMETAKRIFREEKIPGKLRIIRENLWYPSYRLETDREPVKGFLDFLRSSGHSFYEKQNESVSDGNIFVSRLGIPTVLFGPKGGKLHCAGEFVELSSLEKYRDYLEKYLDSLTIGEAAVPGKE